MLVFCLFFLLFIIEKSIIRQNEFALGKLNRLSDAGKPSYRVNDTRNNGGTDTTGQGQQVERSKR